MTDTRNEALRAMLVERVAGTAPRRRWRLPVIGIGAFVVAGALTGGAVAGAVSMQERSDQHEVAAIVDGTAAAGNDLVGDPVQRFADGPTTLQLPPRPDVAGVRVVVGGQCSPDITLLVGAVSGSTTEVSCGQPAVAVGQPRADDRTIAITPDRAGSMTVWAGWATPHREPGPSAQQRAEIADGVVTRSEYLAAFNRYLGCMRASGHPIDGVATSTTTFLWGIPESALRASDDCQAAEFSDTAAIWDAEHPGDGSAPYDAAADDPRFRG